MLRLKIRHDRKCRWDLISLGEVMLRFDPGEGRVRTARTFKIYEGGGEYNVARALRKCFGMKTAIISAIVDNEIGRLLEDLIMQGGVDMSHVKWVPFDGVGRVSRNGLNFTERGFGIRAAKGCSDRGHTAISQMIKGDIDWKQIFEEESARWFHTGGIFAALSETTPDVAKEAMLIAKETGTTISYDLNYRPSLWAGFGGKNTAQKINRDLVQNVDVLVGNEEDFVEALGFKVKGIDMDFSKLDRSEFRKTIRNISSEYSNLKAIAVTLRHAKTATINDWGAILYYDGEFYQAAERCNLEILDRVGGGDGFVSGLIYGFLNGKTPEECVNYGAAHGALTMTTPGDTSMATLDEIEQVLKSTTVRVKR